MYAHFLLGKEKQLKSGEVTMVLEDAWNLVGANKPPKRGTMQHTSDVFRRLAVIH